MELLWEYMPPAVLVALGQCHTPTREFLAFRAHLALLTRGASFSREAAPSAVGTAASSIVRGLGGLFGVKSSSESSGTSTRKTERVQMTLIDFGTGFYSLQWRVDAGAGGGSGGSGGSGGGGASAAKQMGDIKISDVSAVRAEGTKRVVLLGRRGRSAGVCVGAAGAAAKDGAAAEAPPVLLALDADYEEQRDQWTEALAALLARVRSDAAAAAEERGLDQEAAEEEAAEEEDAGMVGQMRAAAKKKEHDMRRQAEMREAEAKRQERKKKLGLGDVGMKYTAMAMANQQ